MFQADRTISDIRRSVIADDVMPMVMVGTARLTKIALSHEHNHRSQSANDASDKDLSVEHVAVLGEN
jgi:hypothetical protein